MSIKANITLTKKELEEALTLWVQTQYDITPSSFAYDIQNVSNDPRELDMRPSLVGIQIYYQLGKKQ